MNVLEVDSIYKVVNKSFTLSDIYLKCKTGEIVGLLGRNGSGKSLLLQIIFGTMDAQSKSIRINGIVYKSPYKTEGLINYLPQHSFLPKRFYVKDIVNQYVPTDAMNIFINDPQINKCINQKVKTLSGGELKYLEIKLLLHYPSKFTFLDEPFNKLSPLLCEKVVQMIRNASKQKGIIVTDHNFKSISSIISKMYLMRNGSLQTVKGEELKAFGYLPR